MTPANIVHMAALKQLDVIALTDHNSAKNAKATMECGKQSGIIVLPGLELTTSEEVHVLCLFHTIKDAMAMDAYVHDRLIKIANDERLFGEQLIMDEREQIVAREPYLLINATTIDFLDVYDLVSSFHGGMIPAHIDKTSNSLLYQLGFIPEGSRFRCAEVKDCTCQNRLLKENEYLRQCRIITDSDAHYLEDISEAGNVIEAEEKSIDAVFDALFLKE